MRIRGSERGREGERESDIGGGRRKREICSRNMDISNKAHIINKVTAAQTGMKRGGLY